MKTFFQFLKSLFSASKPDEPQAPSVGAVELEQEPKTHREYQANPEAEIIADLFSHTERESHEIRIAPISEDGGFLERDEKWEREGGALRNVNTRGKVRTCSGHVVDPDQIKFCCAIGNRYDAEGYECCVCRVSMCQIHTKFLRTAQGEKAYCHTHFEEAVLNLNTWEVL